uniref:Uncharacterized protein n=1 Tax=Anguilla anguilla TaxID=7936 RepID=A0A0E9VYR6_ANGAN
MNDRSNNGGSAKLHIRHSCRVSSTNVYYFLFLTHTLVAVALNV